MEKEPFKCPACSIPIEIKEVGDFLTIACPYCGHKLHL